MKNTYSVVILVMVFLSLVVYDVYGQTWTKRRRYTTIGVHVGAINYLGEMAPDASIASLRIQSTRPNVGVTYTRKLTPRVSVRGSMSWGRIFGDDSRSASQNEEDNSSRFERNLNFRNDIKEVGGLAIFDLYENRLPYNRRPGYTPYGFIGLALFHHNPKGYYNGSDPNVAQGYYALQPLGTEGQHVNDRESKDYPHPYSKIQIAIPVGIGIKYKLDRYWDLGFEICWRKTFTDYLDDVSGNYADKADLVEARGRTAAILADRSGDSGFPAITDANGFKHVLGFGQKGDQRGDVNDKDWYISAGFSLNYILPYRAKTLKFK